MTARLTPAPNGCEEPERARGSAHRAAPRRSGSTGRRRRHAGTRGVTVLAAALVLALAATGARAQDDADWEDDWGDEAPAVEVHGFAEWAAAARTGEDAAAATDFPLAEARFRLELVHAGDRSNVRFKADFTRDDVLGTDGLDVREAALQARVTDWLDLRVGRQVLTWGTGDLVFLNDLFPKDFQSFFIGRDDEFLKAPATAVRAGMWFGGVNVDLVWTPVFEPDRFITGERLSFAGPGGTRQGPATPGTPVMPRAPARTLGNGEAAARIAARVGGAELALYAYRGFTKEPVAIDAATLAPTFARRNAAGASVRANALGGILWVEGVWYDSEDDRDGTNPWIPNSQARWVVGFEHELHRDVTLSLQDYGEWTAKHDALVASAPDPTAVPDATRHLVTGRLTVWARRQTVGVSAFAFVSPDDGDGHGRLSVTWRWSDALTFTVGALAMWGDDDTFFGQLGDDTNAFARVRYAF